MAAGVLWAALGGACWRAETETPAPPGRYPGAVDDLPDGWSPGDPTDDPGTPGADTGAPGGAAWVDVTLPTLQGWSFFGRAQGAPADVYGITEDAGGNVWVAGGVEGLFLLRKGASAFERFTLADGLRPYGFMPDGSAPPGEPHLKVVSVAGGPPGTVFVGYAGKPHCEFSTDPSSFKSGDADRVMLTASGIAVVHYDISSGEGVVPGYTSREKLCTIHRIAYDAKTNSVWFGANHGIARGNADFPGAPTCNGVLDCSGVEEHAHPAIRGLDGDGVEVVLTDDYYGLSPASDGDVWIGGANRSARFRYMSNPGGPANFWHAQALVERPEFVANRLDVWEDAWDETHVPAPGPDKRDDDLVSAMAAMPDGTVWVSSFAWGLAQLDERGRVLRKLLGAPTERYLSSLGRDPTDDSVWAGHRYGGGLTRVSAGGLSRVGAELGELASHSVWDIQAGTAGGGRRMLVAFRADGHRTGAVGIYSGP
ncbi:MAG: hypothetical protein L0Y66_24925 [Myxococcaceae bacterium]|nr:hypothetical protein [Myxococcaceae bacterium]MCI0669168.1 hypothetical protein [Myxococcaceae bacterium]